MHKNRSKSTFPATLASPATKKGTTRNKKAFPAGPWNLAFIITNERLRVVFDDLITGEPCSETAKKLSISAETLSHARTKIKETIKLDAEFQSYIRNKLASEYVADATTGLRSGMRGGDASMINGFFKGLGIYKSEDSIDVNLVSPEEIQKRRLAAMAVDKVPTRKERG